MEAMAIDHPTLPIAYLYIDGPRDFRQLITSEPYDVPTYKRIGPNTHGKRCCRYITAETSGPAALELHQEAIILTASCKCLMTNIGNAFG